MTPTLQRISPQELQDAADELEEWANHADTSHHYEPRKKLADQLRQLADLMERDAPSENWWDQNSVQCGNCSVEILTRKGSIANNNGLSDTHDSEDEHLCGRCAGEQMYAYQDQLERDAKVIEAARVVDELSGGTCWKKLHQALADLDRT